MCVTVHTSEPNDKTQNRKMKQHTIKDPSICIRILPMSYQTTSSSIHDNGQLSSLQHLFDIQDSEQSFFTNVPNH